MNSCFFLFYFAGKFAKPYFLTIYLCLQTNKRLKNEGHDCKTLEEMVRKNRN